MTNKDFNKWMKARDKYMECFFICDPKNCIFISKYGIKYWDRNVPAFYSFEELSFMAEGI